MAPFRYLLCAALKSHDVLSGNLGRLSENAQKRTTNTAPSPDTCGGRFDSAFLFPTNGGDRTVGAENFTDTAEKLANTARELPVIPPSFPNNASRLPDNTCRFASNSQKVSDSCEKLHVIALKLANTHSKIAPTYSKLANTALKLASSHRESSNNALIFTVTP